MLFCDVGVGDWEKNDEVMEDLMLFGIGCFVVVIVVFVVDGVFVDSLIRSN